MHFLVAFLLSTISLSASVHAADFPSVELDGIQDLRLQRQEWSGFNGVISVGGGFLTGSDSLGGDSFFRSGIVAGSVGYDHQINSVVFGAALEGAYTNFRGNSASGSSRQSANWLASATVRAGIDTGRFMPYVSAGLGFGNYKVERKSDGASDDNTHIGFVVGAGVEARVTDTIFARLDYKHYEFNDQTYRISGWAPFDVEGQADTFTLGLGYRF